MVLANTATIACHGASIHRLKLQLLSPVDRVGVSTIFSSRERIQSSGGVEEIPLQPIRPTAGAVSSKVFAMKFRCVILLRVQYSSASSNFQCSSALKFNAVAEWWDEYIACVTVHQFIHTTRLTLTQV